MWGQRVSITLAFFKVASGMPVAGGNEFLTAHMVFSRDGQLDALMSGSSRWPPTSALSLKAH